MIRQCVQPYIRNRNSFPSSSFDFSLTRANARASAKLMKLSDALTTLNVQRYADWSPEFSLDNARQAILALMGTFTRGYKRKRYPMHNCNGRSNIF